MLHGQSHTRRFLVAVAEGDTWTRPRIDVAAPQILIIEAVVPLLEDAKDIGIAILALAILFGLSVGVALIFHYL